MRMKRSTVGMAEAEVVEVGVEGQVEEVGEVAEGGVEAVEGDLEVPQRGDRPQMMTTMASKVIMMTQVRCSLFGPVFSV